MSSTRPRGLTAPDVAFLAKPFDIDDVLDLVTRQACGARRMRLYAEA